MWLLARPLPDKINCASIHHVRVCHKMVFGAQRSSVIPSDLGLNKVLLAVQLQTFRPLNFHLLRI
jgi:hypothetical protein